MGRSVEYIETVIREPVVTRPLFMQQRNLVGDPSNYFFTHDGNKNVADVVSYQRARGVVAHYDYAPFGAVTSATGSLSSINPFRFSSEYHDDTLGLVYYNYRHYNSFDGRWLALDEAENGQILNLYNFLGNQIGIDMLGLDRYISNFSILLHEAVAVDLWECSEGTWVKTGTMTFDFHSAKYDTAWTILQSLLITEGEIDYSYGINLYPSYDTIASTPCQDKKMLEMIWEELSNPPLYGLGVNNCINWSHKVIQYGK